MITRGSLSIIDFLISIKKLADELTALGAPPSDADLLVYTTRGLGPAYKELIIAMRTRDYVVQFEELFDKIIDHETFLLHNEKQNLDPAPPTTNLAKHSQPLYRPSRPFSPSSTPGLLPNPSLANKQPKSNPSNPNPTICQFCDKHGHDANKCFKLFPHLRSSRPSANHVTASPSPHNPWIVDSGAFHHVTSHMSNLSLHQPYEGLDDILIGDGSGLKITHTGSISFSPSFNLSNVLCVPSIKQNLIFVSKFFLSNHTSNEFFPSYFVVKDLCTGTPLLHGRNRHDLYEWPITEHSNKSPAMALSTDVTAKTSPVIWHGRLGHPSLKIIKPLVHSGLMSLSSSI